MSTPIEAIAGVPNAGQVLPTLVGGGQPALAHLRAFKAAGGEVVLDVRDPSEPRPFDEPREAAALGLEYICIPVTPATMTDETLARITEVLRANAGRQLFFHCASGNRVGATLLPYLMIDQAMEEQDALQAAMRVGLRDAGLLQWGLSAARGGTLG